MLTGNKDLDMLILNKLNDYDLVRVCQVNKYMMGLCNDQMFWLNRILTKFPYLSLEVMNKYKDVELWSEYYRRLRRINPNTAMEHFDIGVDFNKFDYVILAVENGVDVRTLPDFYIKDASQRGFLDIVKFLVEHNCNSYSYNDYTLILASENGHLNVVKYLVSIGFDIHVDDDFAMRHASYYNHLEVVKYLMSVGANMHANNDEAIRWASQEGNLDIIKFLVSVGANIHANNDEAVKKAYRHDHLDIVEYLVSLGAPDPKQFFN